MKEFEKGSATAGFAVPQGGAPPCNACGRLAALRERV